MNKRGFSLIEVLVALAIFALAAVVLASAYLNVLTAYQRVGQGNERDASLQLVRAALLTETDRRKAEDGGDIVLDDTRTARWHAKIEESNVADLFRVTLESEFAPEKGAHAATFSQVLMVLRPSWSDAVVAGKLRAATRARLGPRPTP